MQYAKTLLLVLTAGAVGYLIVRRYAPSAAGSAGTTSHVKPVVEKVLHQHQGEETPMVQAFEAALEEERQHEEQLAKDTGVHA